MIGSRYIDPVDAMISDDVLKNFPALAIMNVFLGFSIETRQEHPEWFLIGDSEQLRDDIRHDYALFIFREWFK